MPLRYYPAVISQDAPDSGFGVVFPDLPGCVSGGDTVQAAAEALALHTEGMIEAGEALPPASAPDASLPDWLAEAGGTTVARVLVPAELPGRSVRANVIMDEGLLATLVAAAAAERMSRSGYIAQAVRERLRGSAG